MANHPRMKKANTPKIIQILTWVVFLAGWTTGCGLFWSKAIDVSGLQTGKTRARADFSATAVNKTTRLQVSFLAGGQHLIVFRFFHSLGNQPLRHLFFVVVRFLD